MYINRFKKLFCLPVCIVVLTFGCDLGMAQTGKLSGKITDTEGKPIPGVNIILEGTRLGAGTDVDGIYNIINIPPGRYSVRITSVGFQNKVVEGVLIESNQTTTLNQSLSEEVVEGDEIVVQASQPVVDVTQTSSVETITRENIDALPVQNVDDIVNLQAGVVDGHFRGGRQGEVQYQVNGVSINNPFNNQAIVRLDRSVLQEVQVISGTFDAQYGQAMSGVVNAVLRSGQADRFEYNFETFVGDYLAPENEDKFPHINHIDPTARRNIQFNLSGPTFLNNTTFLVNGQRLVDMGYLYGRRRFNPTDRSNFEENIYNPTGDSAWVSMDFSKEWSGMFKLTNKSLPGITVSYQAISSLNESRNYSHGWRFNPEGLSTADRFSVVHGLKWTHSISDRFFYNFSLRQNYVSHRDYKYRDLTDPRYFEAGRPRGDGTYDNNIGGILQGVDMSRFVQRTNAAIAKGEMTFQATNIHLLKTGMEFQVSNLEFGTPGQLVATTRNDSLVLVPRRDLPRYQVSHYVPRSGSFYMQDRMEWESFRVRAGFRLQFFDANTTIPSDLQNPANAIAGAPESRPKETSVKLSVAPRIGISFPITTSSSLFFSYGHFHQMPPLGEMFQRADYSILEDLQANETDFGVMGNPNLKPEFTTQYEFGFKAQPAEKYGMDISMFFKDIRRLLGVEFVETYAAAEYARFTNIDFGSVRGGTIELDYRTRQIFAKLDYTFQLAMGNSSSPEERANRAAAGEDPRPRRVPLDWDQRHTINTTLQLRDPENYALTAIIKYNSGQPYTPAIGSGFDADLEANSGRKDDYVDVDLRGEKFFRLGNMKMSVFFRGFNLLNTLFTNGFVFPNTGSPFYTLNPAGNRAQLDNPARFNTPRHFELGIRLDGFIPN